MVKILIISVTGIIAEYVCQCKIDLRCRDYVCVYTFVTQVQYNFGLGSIIQLLRVLRSLKKAEPVESEQTLVVRAVRDVILPQLVDRDEPLFLSFVNDLFPGIILEKTCCPGLEEALAKELDAAGLVDHSPWTFKLMQVITHNKYNNNITTHSLTHWNA